jgi:uncharacterized RDD family membrane protein YckC
MHLNSVSGGVIYWATGMEKGRMPETNAPCYDPGVPTGTSAAQNGPVIRICSKCGALLLEDRGNCSFCADSHEDERFLQPIGARSNKRKESTRYGAIAATETVGPQRDETEPEWRVEVSKRLQQYRVRRGRVRPEPEPTQEFQSGLPFRKSPKAGPPPEEERRERPHFVQKPVARSVARQRQNERVEIRIQPELDFSSAASERARPQDAMVPVASLRERRWSGLLDALFLGVTCAGFMALFRSLGGQIALDKMDVAVYLAVAYLFYSVYFSLFTTLAGATPGMQLRGLTIVRLDGSLPDTKQLTWRSFGYALSGATLMLGYVWALWDEDHFTWQDRISQTYVTAAMPVAGFDSFGSSLEMGK